MEEGCRGKAGGGEGETERREKCRSGGRGGDSIVETGAPCSWRRERERELSDTKRGADCKTNSPFT